MRYGLCCKFQKENIKFKSTKLSHIKKLSSEDRYKKLESILKHNLDSLKSSVYYCKNNNIGGFRISSTFSQFVSIFTKDYDILFEKYKSRFRYINNYCKNNNIILSQHPDQFCVLNSNKDYVVKNSISILKDHNIIAELLGVETINIHVGGVYDNKEKAIERFIINYEKLPDSIKNKLSIENDEKCYSIEDCLYISKVTGVSVCFDIHHERCYRIKNKQKVPENNYIKILIKRCAETYIDKTPIIHLSSPKMGWSGNNKDNCKHANYIAKDDVIETDLDIICDIEAKHKELSIKKLINRG